MSNGLERWAADRLRRFSRRLDRRGRRLVNCVMRRRGLRAWRTLLAVEDFGRLVQATSDLVWTSASHLDSRRAWADMRRVAAHALQPGDLIYEHHFPTLLAEVVHTSAGPRHTDEDTVALVLRFRRGPWPVGYLVSLGAITVSTGQLATRATATFRGSTMFWTDR